MFRRKPTPTKTTSGAVIESAAASWLQRQGLICLERNFRCRGGEIDLIMRKGGTLIFVEVRLRNRDDFGSAVESVTTAKQRRVIHAAQYYLAMHNDKAAYVCRFDVLAAKYVATSKYEEETLVWNWVQDAFYAG